MFKENLRFYRKKNDLTQKQIANYLGIAESSYANYEQGRGGELKISYLLKLCELYLVTPDELLGYDYKENKSTTNIKDNNGTITNVAHNSGTINNNTNINNGVTHNKTINGGVHINNNNGNVGF